MAPYKARIGKIRVEREYILDLNDDSMVALAKKRLSDEVVEALKNGGNSNSVKITEEPSLSYTDISTDLIVPYEED